MKRAALMAICLFLSVPAAYAQEQQVYSYGSVTSVYNPQEEQAIREMYAAQAQQAYQRQYIQQDRPVMQRFPAHPGDYRDAVDRGSWTVGNSRPSPYSTYYYGP